MRSRVAIVSNPRTVAGARAAVWSRAMDQLATHAEVTAQLDTRGDGHDVERIAALVERVQPDVLAVVGGDGTANAAVSGLLAGTGRPQPALAIFPTGTGNNLARSLGLPRLDPSDAAAVDFLVTTVAGHARHHIDVGVVNDRVFVGSFAVGMDADALVLRNRFQQHLRLRGHRAGYALYVWTCALSLAVTHGGRARLSLDALEEEVVRIYSFVVTNAPIYAGEFRFDGDNDCADGRLDAQVFTNAFEYLRQYASAWRRHVHYRRGCAVQPWVGVRRARTITLEFAAPVSAQIDGEVFGSTAAYSLRVLPRAICVCVPAAFFTRLGR